MKLMSIEVGNTKHVINISYYLRNIHKHDRVEPQYYIAITQHLSVAHISLLEGCCLGNSLYDTYTPLGRSITQSHTRLSQV